MNYQKNIIFSVKIILHILFWVCVYLFYTYFLGYGTTNTKYVNYFSLYLLPITIGTSYLFNLHLVPEYLQKNKKGLFLLYSCYTFIISFCLIIYSIFYSTVLLSDLKIPNITSLTKTLPLIILGIYFVIIISIVLSLTTSYFKSLSKNATLQKEHLATQLKLEEQKLKFLKAQIHPHFLFNTLNTIYGYTLKKSKKAPEMVLILSSLLDYILYQIDKPYVSIENELKHIKNYIELEKMRFYDKLNINLNESISNPKTNIAPMLFITFVENSFKHGVEINGEIYIKIDVISTSKKIQFKVKNSRKPKKNNKQGIGLKNIENRLNILYPKRHSLIINDEDDYFEIDLNITLQ